MISLSPLVLASLLVSSTFSSPTGHASPNPPAIAHNVLSKRTQPNTGADLPDTDTHPNQLDQVETAFNDALEMAAYVLQNIDTDTTIFPHYFDEGDRAGVKNVFAAILGTTTIPQNPTTGNALLGNILVQTTDQDGGCDGKTLAYMGDHNTDNPFIVLCPSAFNKKAVTILKGAPDPSDNPDDAAHYIQCEELDANGHVSYLMNSLGATLLHEYTHYDSLVQFV